MVAAEGQVWQDKDNRFRRFVRVLKVEHLKAGAARKGSAAGTYALVTSCTERGTMLKTAPNVSVSVTKAGVLARFTYVGEASELALLGGTD